MIVIPARYTTAKNLCFKLQDVHVYMLIIVDNCFYHSYNTFLLHMDLRHVLSVSLAALEEEEDMIYILWSSIYSVLM